MIVACRLFCQGQIGLAVAVEVSHSQAGGVCSHTVVSRHLEVTPGTARASSVNCQIGQMSRVETMEDLNFNFRIGRESYGPVTLDKTACHIVIEYLLP